MVMSGVNIFPLNIAYVARANAAHNLELRDTATSQVQFRTSNSDYIPHNISIRLLSPEGI